ncbi:MAG: squalene/phytoene synthase family protein [Paracoccaceae bacterium]
MSLQACAEIVRRGDPDRFLAAMAAPPKARAVLFPVYAFNVEVSRAPWLTEEPMIAEMRLQWWRDVLEEIANGGPVRRHEVTEPLAEVLDPEGARLLDALIVARRWDIYKDPFENEAAFAAYIEATAGGLMWAASRALGAQGGEAAVRDIGWAGGLAGWLRAIPDLESRGRKPLADGRMTAVAELAGQGLERLRRGRRAGVPVAARPAVLAGWQAGAILRQARRDPARVADGTLGQSEFARRGSLLWASFTGS